VPAVARRCFARHDRLAARRRARRQCEALEAVEAVEADG